MRITLLLHNAYGVGGTIRTTCNLAGALAAEHEVEFVSVLRIREVPSFDHGPRVRVRPPADLRKEPPGCTKTRGPAALPGSSRAATGRMPRTAR